MAGEAVLSGKVGVLPEAVVGRIAAGEVVERPASVVKELVENAIDAGSRRIELELKSGGRVLIRIQDDGEGMPRGDATLAFQRHATSKIRTDADLQTVRTLGFRGEALPSIAAVSKIRMVTSPEGAAAGTEIRNEGGAILSVQDAPPVGGTLVEVRELFYNTPARLRFLKSVPTELSHITHHVHQEALAHPGIAFRLIHNDKTLLDCPAVAERLQRIEQVFGKDITQHLVFIDEAWAGIKVWGVVSRPEHSRGSRGFQEVFVNRRAVSSPVVLRAVYDSYEPALMKGRHPVLFIFLEMDGALVDVNVHPAKREVRFRDQRSVHELVRDGVRAALRRIAHADLGLGTEAAAPRRAERIREAAETYLLSRQSPSAGAAVQRPFHRPTADPEGIAGRQDGAVGSAPETGQFEGLPDAVAAVGQVYDSYLLAGIGGEFWIVDQHAAHERVLYERYLQALGASKVPVQGLLIPETVEFPASRGVVLKDVVAHLERLGLEVEVFGPRTAVVRAVPTFLAKADLQALLRELVEDWLEYDKIRAADDRSNALVATLACHAAVKANQALNHAEMGSLLRDVAAIPSAVTCPHGRPLRIKYSRKDLDHLFRR